jgi:putative peptidoglycan lipid II flippase
MLDWGHRGLAASTACIAVISFITLYLFMRRHLQSLDTAVLLKTLAKVLLASTVLGAVAWAGKHYLLSDWATQAFWSRSSLLLLVIAVAGMAYALTAMLLQLQEVKVLAGAVRRRLPGRRS